MICSDDWDALDAALDAALDLDGAARERFLGTLAPATRAALVPLLRDALADDPVLDHRDAVLGPLAESGVGEGQRVGPYRLEALVGEGGMGRVFRARRADGAFDQTVAVKVVRASLTLPARTWPSACAASARSSPRSTIPASRA